MSASSHAVVSSTVAGSDGEPILVDTHRPEGDARAVMLLAHGFKGYKDYGMFPRLATRFAAHGIIAHRFNFSHSGMTNTVDTFERPDLFEQDTWNRQVFDLAALIEAIADGDLPGRDVPLFLFGHSRGGVTSLLTAGRLDGETALPIDGVMTAAAPSTCNSLSDDDAKRLMEEGFLVSPSGRTGQDLRVGKRFLEEQLEDPEAFDLPRLVGRISCPLMVVHGTDDSTVPAACATMIAEAHPMQPRPKLIDGGDHVFNTPNPFPAEGAEESDLLRELIEVGEAFVDMVVG